MSYEKSDEIQESEEFLSNLNQAIEEIQSDQNLGLEAIDQNQAIEEIENDQNLDFDQIQVMDEILSDEKVIEEKGVSHTVDGDT